MSKWLLIRYMLTGLYVGFATVGVSVHWFLDHGVTWSQLVNWSTCVVRLIAKSSGFYISTFAICFRFFGLTTKDSSRFLFDLKR